MRLQPSKFLVTLSLAKQGKSFTDVELLKSYSTAETEEMCLGKK